MNKRHSNSSNSVLVSDSFPFPLIRRAVTIRPWPLRRLRERLASHPVATYWGHANSRPASEALLGVSLAPASERPALDLSPNRLPALGGKTFSSCYVLSPDYRPGFHPPLGAEVPPRTDLRMVSEGSLFTNESDIEYIYKPMSNLRGKLKKAGFADAESLVPQRGRAIMFPLARIKWRNVSKLVDICGCLFQSREVYDAISYWGKDTSGCMPERRT